MNVEFAAVVLAPGLAVGSFLNVVAARLPLNRSIVSPGSACPSCDTAIAWYDNIPLVSYAVLRGRCRHCGVSISWRYPAVEAATAVLVACAALKFGFSWEFLVAAVFCAVLVAISATDLERRIIPNRIVLPATVVLLAAQTVLHPAVEWIIAGIVAAAFFLLAALAYPGGMGMGDVKLALFLGVVLGRTVSVALMVGMLCALVPSAVVLAKHGKAGRKMTIPFGPFLALGGLVALFAGHTILNWYWGAA
jgi:leader peptidase (prepilin peptidase)/N-methyltransferase